MKNRDEAVRTELKTLLRDYHADLYVEDADQGQNNVSKNVENSTDSKSSDSSSKNTKSEKTEKKEPEVRNKNHNLIFINHLDY